MLDFYLLLDSQNLSSKGLILERIGGIEYEAFVELQAAGIIEPWFDYYGKFRWGSEMIIKKQQQLQKLPVVAAHQSNFKMLASLLQRAKQANCGLLALGD